ncbi:transposase, IS4 family, partial [Ostertagia ostertagi]
MDLLEFLERIARESRSSIPRIFRDRTCPYETLSDVEFKKDYRFSRKVFFDICKIVAEDMRRESAREVDLTVADQVAIGIHLLGRNVMQSDEARITGCHQTTVSRVLMGFVQALNRRAHQYIFWPTEEENIQIRRSFYRKYRLPGICGIIDGTHCRILKPSIAAEDYVCRKGFHSLNVGVIVDYEGRVRWACARWPGSAHDSRVFKTSALYAQLRSGECGGVLIGDAAYASETFLLKAINAPKNAHEIRYNNAICAARARIECAFGVIKRQFHILHGECRYSPEKASQIVIACFVLRNIAIAAKEPEDYDEYEGPDKQDEEVP